MYNKSTFAKRSICVLMKSGHTGTETINVCLAALLNLGFILV